MCLHAIFFIYDNLSIFGHQKDPGLVERQRDAAEHHRGGSTPGLRSKAQTQLKVWLACTWAQDIPLHKVYIYIYMCVCMYMCIRFHCTGWLCNILHCATFRCNAINYIIALHCVVLPEITCTKHMYLRMCSFMDLSYKYLTWFYRIYMVLNLRISVTPVAVCHVFKYPCIYDNLCVNIQYVCIHQQAESDYMVATNKPVLCQVSLRLPLSEPWLANACWALVIGPASRPICVTFCKYVAQMSVPTSTCCGRVYRG